MIVSVSMIVSGVVLSDLIPGNEPSRTDPSSQTPHLTASVPPAPTNLTVFNDGHAILVNFTLPINVTVPLTQFRTYFYNTELGYSSYYYTDSGLDDPNQTANINFHDLEYLGLEIGYTYTFYVTALNQVGESDPSNEANATMLFVPYSVENVTHSWGDGTVQLSWSPPTQDGGRPILSYGLQRYRSVFNETTFEYSYEDWLNATLDLNTTWFNDSGLTNGLSYNYYVFAYNEIGRGWMTGPLVKPGAPSTVQDALAEAGDGYVLLSWSPPAIDCGSPVLQYNVSRYDNYNSTSTSWSLDGSSDHFNDTSAINGHSYSYFIIAINALGGEGEQASVFASPNGALEPPTDLHVTWQREPNGTMEVTLSWTTPAAILGSGVQYDIHKQGGPYVDVAFTIDGSNSSFIDTDAWDNVTVGYYIVARGSESSAEPTGTVWVTPGVPLDAPQDVMLVPTKDSVHLFWKHPADATDGDVSEYLVLRGTGDGAMSMLTVLPGTTMDFNDTEVDAGTSYRYSLVAQRAGANGTASAVLDVTTLSTPGSGSGVENDAWIWMALIALAAGAAVAIFAWTRKGWDRRRRTLVTIVALGIAAMLILGSGILMNFGATEEAKATPTTWEPRPGDFFEYSMWGAQGLEKLIVTVDRVGDTTYTMNFTYMLPGQDPIYDVQTGAKNHTEAFATNLFDLPPGTALANITEFRNETIPTKWGWISVEHQVREMDVMGFMTIAIDLSMVKGMVVQMQIGYSSSMGPGSTFNMLKLTDTNIPMLRGA